MKNDTFNTVSRIVNFLFNVISILSTLAVATLIILISGLDYFNIEPDFISQTAIDNFTILDFPESDDENIVFDKRLFFIAISIPVVVFAISIYWRLIRKSYKIRATSVHFTAFSDHYASFIATSLARVKRLEKAVTSQKEKNNDVKITNIYDQISDDQGEFLSRVANRIAAMALVYNGTYCHVSIKVFSLHSGHVRTFSRDDSAVATRYKIDAKFNNELRDYKENSVFKDIIEDKDQHYFFSNNLRRDERKKIYYNRTNPDWKLYYNSCLVVPIAKCLQPSKPDEIWGFICIDTKKGKFKDDYFLRIIVIISRFLSVYFESILSVISVQKSFSGNETSDVP